MDTLIYVFTGLVAVAAGLAGLAIWAPRLARVRVAALALTALLLPLGYVQVIEVLSKPKPMDYEWFQRNVEEAEVLGVSLKEGVAIYLWLHLSGTDKPRYYELPWTLKLAEKLEDAVDGAVKRNSKVVIRSPFQKPSDEDWGDLNVDIIPPPTLPLKPPKFPPRIFNPRGQDV